MCYARPAATAGPGKLSTPSDTVGKKSPTWVLKADETLGTERSPHVHTGKETFFSDGGDRGAEGRKGFVTSVIVKRHEQVFLPRFFSANPMKEKMRDDERMNARRQITVKVVAHRNPAPSPSRERPPAAPAPSRAARTNNNSAPPAAAVAARESGSGGSRAGTKYRPVFGNSQTCRPVGIYESLAGKHTEVFEGSLRPLRTSGAANRASHSARPEIEEPNQETLNPLLSPVSLERQHSEVPTEVARVQSAHGQADAHAAEGVYNGLVRSLVCLRLVVRLCGCGGKRWRIGTRY